MKKFIFPVFVVWFLLAFNLWHNSIRGVWNLSIKDSLTLGSNVIDLAQSIDPTLRAYKPYDGQFYYALAIDPLLITGKSLPFIDVPIYRCKRVLYPLTAHILVFGKETLLPYSLFFLNIFSWFLVGYAGYRFSKTITITPVLPIVCVMTITGLTFSVFRTLTEPLGFALGVLGALDWRENNTKRGLILFALAGLTRESALTIPLSLFLYEIFIEKKYSLLKTYVLLLSFLPLILWSAYISNKVPTVNINQVSRWITLPLMGFLQETFLGLKTNTTSTELQRTLSISLITLFLMISNTLYFFKKRSFWGWMALIQGLFAVCVHGDIWNYHASSARVIILLMVFSFFHFFSLLISAKRKLSSLTLAES